MIIFTGQYLKLNQYLQHLREGGVGGVNRYKALEGYNNSKLVIETAAGLIRSGKKVYCSQNHSTILLNLQRIKKRC